MVRHPFGSQSGPTAVRSGRSGRLHQAKILVVAPLAVLTLGSTAALIPGPIIASTGPTGVAASSWPNGPAAESDVVSTPQSALPSAPAGMPATLRASGQLAAATDATFTRLSAPASAAGISPVALAAYQRAETVINAADLTCHLSWQLVAAVARVESDDGQVGGAAIGTDGVARPAILGPVLDGSSDTSSIADTDAGQYDGDIRHDRAIGPLQLLPSTWSVVGVDGDADGVRDPQDIDDASLAAAVYLCSGDDDLAVAGAQRAALLRYNHSRAYVDTVLAVLHAYLDGDVATVPSPVVSAGSLVPLVSLEPPTQLLPATDGQDKIVGTTLRGPVETANAARLADTRGDALIPTAPAPADLPAPPAPPGSLDPPGDNDVPTDAPTDGTQEPTDPTGPSEEAVASCVEAGLVDDPAVADDDYDLCLIAFDEAVVAGKPTAPEPNPEPTVR